VSPRTFIRLFTQIQLLPVMENGEETLVGGQAVMEGVMMRAPHSYCVAVRKPSGEVVTEEMPLARISDTHKIFKLPVFRGVGTLFQAMSLGIKALKFSTNAALDNPDVPEDKRIKEIPTWALIGPLLFSLASFLFLYKFMPLLLVTRLAKIYPVLSGRLMFNLVDGAIRIAIFLTFLYVLSRMKDIRRMFSTTAQNIR
jgi:uncharacterized protein YqhQ